MCNIAKQRRYLATCQIESLVEGLTVTLDRVSLIVCSACSRISFAVVDHAGR